MGYIKIEIDEDVFVLHCTDCGAYILNGKEEDIKHYPTCKPTDMTQFNNEDIMDSHEEGFDFDSSIIKDIERKNE